MACQAPARIVGGAASDLWSPMRSIRNSSRRTLMRTSATSSLPPTSRPISTASLPKKNPIPHRRSLPERPVPNSSSLLRPLPFTSRRVGLGLRIQSSPTASIFRLVPSSRSLSTWSPTSRTNSIHSSNFSQSSRPLNSSLSQLLRVSPHRTLSGVGSSSQNLLAHMEQTANNNPTSATAQNAFYSALLRADMPAIVAERYQSGRFANNSSTDATYHKALERLPKPDSFSGYRPASFGQAQNSLSNEQIQAIGQAMAAHSTGAQVAGPKAKSTGTGDKSSPLYVVVEESLAAGIFKWVKFFLYLGLFGYISMVVVALAVETSGVLKKVGNTQPNEAKPQQQTVRFNDVHGCEEAKEELQELVEFLKNPKKFSTLGGKLPKGVLLTGPPGTGKTLLARAVAGEAGVPFFFASGSEFDEMYVGVGAKRIRELFSNARAKGPAIIFIDELDAIGSKRVDRDPAYVKQSLNQLLTELDGFNQDTGVIIIAATNLPQLLDKALTRPGRFDRNVVVPLPDVRGRAAILKHHMKKVQIASDVDETVIARSTTGFSGADLENLVNQAAVHASRNKALKVTTADLDWSKDKILMGSERRSAVIQDKDKLMTAYHEAGHALVGYYTEAADPMYKVTIIPRGPSLGVTYYMPEMDQVSQTKKQLIAQIDVSLGGKLAEEVIYGEDSVTTGCSSDLSNATRVARMMITDFGMSTTLGDVASDYSKLSPETKAKIETETRQMLELARVRGSEILRTHRTELERVARALIDYETLTRDEMIQVMKGEKLPRLTTSKGKNIKLPEALLAPSVGEITAAVSNAAGKNNETSDGGSSGESGSNPPESGEGGVKM